MIAHVTTTAETQTVTVEAAVWGIGIETFVAVRMVYLVVNQLHLNVTGSSRIIFNFAACSSKLEYPCPMLDT